MTNLIPHKTRPIRLSDKTWEELKKVKLKSGFNWNKFIIELLKNAKSI